MDGGGPLPKIIVYLHRSYEKLHCKGEPHQLSSLRDLLVHRDIMLLTCDIRIYRDKTMADKLKNIPNNDSQNYPFCRLKLGLKRLNIRLNKSSNQNS